ncbi:two-component regulator propeller domain-containing protein [Saccharicrinis sp. FJH62]|uniref:hybrid sensor histidine kinase/response regulator transcription factor n=1 Tax=Saccharicrinis sp. FJH62 TaxID=3344657 RepID=UPI0035D45262
MVYSIVIFTAVNALMPLNAVNRKYISNYLQFRQLTSIDGLSNNTVFNITQDAEGLMWIATREGLNKFDGKTVKSYYSNGGPDNIPGNTVRQVLVTSNKKLVVGTDKGACCYQKEKDRFIPIITNGFTIGDVIKIIELSSGQLMAATSSGLYLIDSSFYVKRVSTENYRDICEYKKDIIWGAAHDEIHMMNLNGEIIKHYNNNTPGCESFDFTSVNVEYFYKHSSGDIWIGTKRNGLGLYNENKDAFTSLKMKEGVNPMEDNFVRVINEDNKGRLWIGTESGLYIYDVEQQKFLFYGQTFNSAYKGLNDKAIYSIYKSTDNTMWVGTYFGGVNYTIPSESGFVNIFADGGMSTLSGNAVSEMLETNNGEIWIGSEDAGISIYNPVTEKFRYLKHEKNNPYSLASNNVHALTQDDEGNVWIGTFIGGLNKLNAGTKKIEKVKLLNPNPLQYVFSIKIDSKKRMWVGAISGLYLKEPDEVDFKMFKPEYFQDNFIYHVNEDQNGNIWACSYYTGIYKIDKQQNVTRYNTQTEPAIKSNVIVYSFTASKGDLWFGTVEGGLIKYNSQGNTFRSYTMKDGLPNNTVYAITEDKDGNIWFSTNKGLVMYNLKLNTFTKYSEQHGLPGNQYNYKSCFNNSEGLIYFGAVNGLTIFDPGKLQIKNPETKILFTDFKLFNSPLKIGDRGILSSHINYQDKVVLNYKYNVFAIDFIGINYRFPKNNYYAYYLDGFETDWNEVGNKTSATYTNLSPGNYTFNVKVFDSEGHESGVMKSLKITILPPFWLSIWGIMLYLLILLSLIYGYWRYSMQRQSEKLKIKMTQLEKEKNDAINQHRMNFFTYISHEFKTPLTIVIATIDQLLEYKDVLPQLKDYGIMIRKNAHRLLFLINQLMEFRKTESDHSTLKLNNGDIIGFLRSTFDLFVPLMEKKNISGRFTTNKDSHIVYFDADKIEKILTNLLSNSCNSFQKKGNILIDVKIIDSFDHTNPNPNEKLASEMVLTIKDTGPGIPQSKIDQVFNPFFTNSESNIYKSGIGLSLVKSLTEFLNGTINITSDGKTGTTVIIHMPLIHYPKPQLIQNEDFISRNTKLNDDLIENAVEYNEEMQPETFKNNENASFELMIVEDNKDLSQFLSHHFSRFFKVTVAYDGKAALQRIEHSQPDIIVSDIMMPEMDGYELCSSIKDNFETCHIPVILLTAKSGHDSKLEGLNLGADAYIDKPFNLRELELTIRNILRTKQNIRNDFAKTEVDDEKVPAFRLNIKDEMFLEKLDKIILDQLSNAEYSVEQLCNDLLISRTLLHLKLKKITGLSTTEYIRKIKMQEARKFLKTGMYTVSETAYKVGYSDPAYFSKSFKQYYNVSPSSIIADN